MRATPPLNQSFDEINAALDLSDSAEEIDAALGLNDPEESDTALNESEEIYTLLDPNESKKIHNELDQNVTEEIHTQEIQTALDKPEKCQLSPELKEPSKKLTTNRSQWLPTKIQVVIIIAVIAFSVGLARVWVDKARIEVMEECAKEKSKIKEEIEICHQKIFEKKNKTLHDTMELITHSKEDINREYSQCKEENENLKNEYKDKLTKLIQEIAKLEGQLMQLNRENKNLKAQLSELKDEYMRCEKDHESLKIREENCSDSFIKCDRDSKKKQEEWKKKEDSLEAKVLQGDLKLEECNKHNTELQYTLNDCQKNTQASQKKNEDPPVFVVLAFLIAAFTGALYCICLASKGLFHIARVVNK